MEGETEIDEIDRISGLPDFILHRILSILRKKEAIQTCVLSKRWKYIWDTFPILRFDQYLYIRDEESTPEYIKKTREFKNLVDKTLKKFTRKKLIMERFDLRMPFVERNQVSLVDQWVALCLENGVREIVLMVNPEPIFEGTGYDAVYTIPETTFRAKPTSDSPKLDLIQKLSLKWVRIDEYIIQDIVRHCPNLNHLHLENTRGLKTLVISKLDKLETVKVINTGFQRDLGSISIDAPSLKHLHLCSPGMHCRISLTSCRELRELRLHGCCITDDVLQLYLSRFNLLEVLELHNCRLLRKVKISAQRLRSLQLLFGYIEIEEIQIDAPALSLFDCAAFRTMPVLFSKNVPCLMNINYNTRDRVVDSCWFSELREFLGRSPQRKFFTLKFCENEANFDLGKLREREVPPFVAIDHLKITFGFRASVDCATLIDGLLWSCHPKLISVPLDSMLEQDCIKVLCEKLLKREHSLCCDSSRMKCWRHHLKDARIERFGEKEYKRPLPSKYFLDKLSSLGNKQEVRFKLEWNF